MSANAQWVWRITAITVQTDSRPLTELLDDGWEPYAATINSHGQNVYHLRKKVKK